MIPEQTVHVVRCEICRENYNSVTGKTIHCPACRSGQFEQGATFNDTDELDYDGTSAEDQDAGHRIRKRDSIMKVCV